MCAVQSQGVPSSRPRAGSGPPDPEEGTCSRSALAASSQPWTFKGLQVRPGAEDPAAAWPLATGPVPSRHGAVSAPGSGPGGPRRLREAPSRLELALS